MSDRKALAREIAARTNPASFLFPESQRVRRGQTSRAISKFVPVLLPLPRLLDLSRIRKTAMTARCAQSAA